MYRHAFISVVESSAGPLHSAPSFSGGTVQTGSTLDPSELGRPPPAGLGLQRHSSETLHAAPHLLTLQRPSEQAWPRDASVVRALAVALEFF